MTPLKDSELKEFLVKAVTGILETRKTVVTCLQEKETRALTDTSQIRNGELDASVWNDLGLFFLCNRMHEDAERIYAHMLEVIMKLESRVGHIHKGLPLYNMGVAQINQRNFDEGIPNVLKAYEEDKVKLGESDAKRALAFRLKEGLFDFTSKVVDNNYLVDFKKLSGLTSIQTSYDLMANMDEAEKLFFAKIVNSKKLVSFHDDVYTKVVMFDNLKNLCLILESNLRRRSGIKELLPELIVKIFHSENWKVNFETEKNKRRKGLIGYIDIADFESKIDLIEKVHPLGR